MKNKKATWPEYILADVYKYEGDKLESWIHILFVKIWQQEQQWDASKDISVVIIFRNGERPDCGHSKGVVFLSVVGTGQGCNDENWGSSSTT